MGFFRRCPAQCRPDPKTQKELLGLALSDQEGAHHWLSVLTDLNNRGVKDILIACVDGLKGFTEAIETIYPNTEIQHCIIHQIRNSLKCVYKASALNAAEMADAQRLLQVAGLRKNAYLHNKCRRGCTSPVPEADQNQGCFCQ